MESSTLGFSQPIIELSEVELIVSNYKYLKTVGNKDAPIAVKFLERKVANYDLKGSDLYSDEYDTYIISFYIPQGSIVAEYDEDGHITKTIERFKNIALPKAISKAVYARFPNWAVTGDIYKVSYRRGDENSKQVYKMKLENGDKTIRVKTDEKGNFL
ncbi:nicotinate-nucleotide adenylyltransferase [Mangrovimonas spongiae]|uniref:Nicotinate-nucleotide adenylyltransferase n=1 Tax=Mangrovimonas spongiae TaxID=2494697 RepID=A0A428K792_9FLAO|nr:nicotinate-nucleotide adenylyltransferase [Mangrovimonas spongiae]